MAREEDIKTTINKKGEEIIKTTVNKKRSRNNVGIPIPISWLKFKSLARTYGTSGGTLKSKKKLG